MSYDIYIVGGDGKPLQLDVPHQLRGGTHALGGTREAWLNVTYNYAPHFYRVIDAERGIRWLYGQPVMATLPRLADAINALGQDEDPDYWRPTEGNARRALVNLVILALLAPMGVWDGD